MLSNNRRFIVSNIQVSELFKRFFGTSGDKHPARLVDISGYSADSLKLVPKMNSLDIAYNVQTDEFYVSNLQGILSGVPEANVMYVDCKNHVIRLFDKGHQLVVYLGVTIEHIHNLVRSLSPQDV